MTSVNDKNCFALSCDTKHVLLRKTLILRHILRCDAAYCEHWRTQTRLLPQGVLKRDRWSHCWRKFQVESGWTYHTRVQRSEIGTTLYISKEF